MADVGSVMLRRRAVVVMGRVPRPGEVKTRLVPPLSFDAAASLYRAFLRDTFRAVDAASDGAREPLDRIFACVPFEPRAEIDAIAPSGWRTILQRGGDLGARIEAAAEDAGAERVIVIGSDFPTMPPARIDEAFASLERAPAVIGPAEDGGYYLIGFGRPLATALLREMPWSTPSLLLRTRERAQNAGIALFELQLGYDVDRVADLPRALADAERPGSLATETKEAIREILASGALGRL